MPTVVHALFEDLSSPGPAATRRMRRPYTGAGRE